MLLKRLYDHSGARPVVSGIKVLRAKARQHFSTRLVQQAVGQRWMSVSQGQIILHGEDGLVVYRIVREPGYYCCHCGEPQDDGESAKDHVRNLHPTAKSPDPCNPSGYELIHYFDCVKQEG